MGGTGTVLGAVFGGVFVQGIIELLAGASLYADLILGSLLLVSLVALPSGLQGAARWLARSVMYRLRAMAGGGGWRALVTKVVRE